MLELDEALIKFFLEVGSRVRTTLSRSGGHEKYIWSHKC